VIALEQETGVGGVMRRVFRDDEAEISLISLGFGSNRTYNQTHIPNSRTVAAFEKEAAAPDPWRGRDGFRWPRTESVASAGVG
jgi:hypothetical protein